MSSMHKQWITTDFWISSDIIFVVSCVFGVMLCYGEQTMTGQVVMDRTDRWHYDSIGVYASALVSCSCWFFIVLVVTKIGYRLWYDMSEVTFTMLSLVKTESSNAFSRHCLYLLYKT